MYHMITIHYVTQCMWDVPPKPILVKHLVVKMLFITDFIKVLSYTAAYLWERSGADTEYNTQSNIFKHPPLLA